jgi:uncharacterized protein YjhX (UPF0386 family)
MLLREDANQKMGLHPQAVIVSMELMSPAQAKREWRSLRAKHGRKGKERMASRKVRGVACFLSRSWSMCECDEKVGRSLARLEECVPCCALDAEGVVLIVGDENPC